MRREIIDFLNTDLQFIRGVGPALAARLDEVLGGVLKPEEPKLVAAEGDVFGDKLACTDSLMNAIAERLPVMADPTA